MSVLTTGKPSRLTRAAAPARQRAGTVGTHRPGRAGRGAVRHLRVVPDTGLPGGTQTAPENERPQGAPSVREAGPVTVPRPRRPADVRRPGDVRQPGDVRRPGDAAQPGAVGRPGDIAQPGTVRQPGGPCPVQLRLYGPRGRRTGLPRPALERDLPRRRQGAPPLNAGAAPTRHRVGAAPAVQGSLSRCGVPRRTACRRS